MFWIPPRKRDQYDPVFANNTWAQIIDACHKNQVPETWTVGSKKAMTIDGTDYVIDIIGKGHDDYADGSGKAPLTFQLHDCFESDIAMNNSPTAIGDWASCDMRRFYMPYFLGLMPTEVQNGIREVNKPSAGSQSTTINTTADKLFLLSEIEIFGRVTCSASGEGTQYDYYKAGNSKVKKLNGDNYDWWERSLKSSDSTRFCRVLDDGSAGYLIQSAQRGVAFAFCF